MWKKETKPFLMLIIILCAQNNIVEKRAMLGKSEKMTERGDLFSTNTESDSPAAKSSCFWERKQAISFFVHSECLLQYIFWSDK